MDLGEPGGGSDLERQVILAEKNSMAIFFLPRRLSFVPLEMLRIAICPEFCMQGAALSLALRKRCLSFIGLSIANSWHQGTDDLALASRNASSWRRAT